MEKQKEALESLKLIKTTLLEVDNGVILPWCTFVLIGICSTVLFAFIPYMYKNFDSTTYVTILSICLIILISLFNYVSTKREIKRQNDLLDRVYSKNQKFIMRIYLISLICGLGFDLFFSMIEFWSCIYFSWMIFLGFPALVYGFLSKNYIEKFSYFLIALGLLGFVFQFINRFFGLNINEHTLFEIARVISILSVGVGYIAIGLKSKKECDCV